MGQLLGIKSFFDYKEFQILNCEVSQATCHNSQALQEAGTEGSLIHSVLTGSHNSGAPKLKFHQVMLKWMTKMRECFALYVICHTIDSLDCNANKIFGIQPYIDHILRLKMYDWEMNTLRDFAKEIIKDNPISAVDTHKISFICHPTMMAMLHCCGSSKMAICIIVG